MAHVREDGKKAIVLLLPVPPQLADSDSPYASYIGAIRRVLPEVCVVDPIGNLREQHASSETLATPKGHFNSSGNAAIAKAVFRAIRTLC